MTITLTRDAFASRLAELARDDWTVTTFDHVDGSRSFIMFDTEPEYAYPRDDEGTVSRLVQCANDRYRAIDAPDTGIDEARNRFDGPNRATLVRRYLAMFRPEVVHYADDWQAIGSTQSEWVGGYGFVLADDMTRTGAPGPASDVFGVELDVYRAWFAGDVFRVVNVRRGAPIVSYGPHGAYIDGYEADEESCGGFILSRGYGYADMVRDITDAEIVQ